MATATFAAELAAARTGARLSQRRAAERLREMGVSVSERAIAGYERGENEPDPIKAASLLAALRKVAAEQPGQGDGAPSAGEPAEPSVAVSDLQRRLRDRVEITLYTEVCAGDGTLVFDEASRVVVEIPRAFVTQFLGFDPPPVMGVSEVQGDSMEPIMHDGDLVLYDLTPEANGAGLYVVNYDGKMACKRVQRYGRGFRLIPENRAAGYEPEVVALTPEGYRHVATKALIEFGIVGRILFPSANSSRLHIQQVAVLLRQMFREASVGQ